MNTAGKIVIPLGILAIGILSMMLLLSQKSEPEKREAMIRPKVVNTTVVKLDDVETKIKGLGKVSSTYPIDIYAESDGTVESGAITFLAGQAFAKGDLILKLDDRQARLELNSKKSELLSALANLLPEIKTDFPQYYQSWLDYFDMVKFDVKLAELPEPQDRKIKLFLARYNVYKLYFSALDLEIKLEKRYFKAPFNGTIVAANVRPGTNVRNGAHLGQIIGLDDLEVEIPIVVGDLSWIDSDSPVFFKSTELGGSWSGSIRRIGSAIDRATQTISVYASLNNKSGSGIYEGIYVEADLPGKIVPNAIAIPRRAVYEDNYVYVIENGLLDLRTVTIAHYEDESVIVNGGLLENDTLVTDVLQGVASGMPAMSRSADTGGELN